MMTGSIVHKESTAFGKYTVVDEYYNGRPARVLYSGGRVAAQSGLALDERSELLFDYNERFMELVRGVCPKRVLVIGGGSFTFPKGLLEELPDVQLDIVEIDGALQDIAKRFFGFRPSARTRVFTSDGLAYLRESQETYDLIIIDVFIEATLPAEFQTLGSMKLAKQHLNQGGILAMNVIAAYYGSRSSALRRQIEAMRDLFPYLGIFPAGFAVSYWLPQNFVVTASDAPHELAKLLRYKELPVFKS